MNGSIMTLSYFVEFLMEFISECNDYNAYNKYIIIS